MAEPVMRKVFSSHVGQIGYDEETGELHVTFARTGKTAVYENVPPKIARSVLTAPSIGMALHESVRGQFSFGYKAGRE
jgi:KTSC domain